MIVLDEIRVSLHKDYYRIRYYRKGEFRYQWNDWESYFLATRNSPFLVPIRVRVVGYKQK